MSVSSVEPCRSCVSHLADVFGLQPYSMNSSPPKWLAELEKDDMDMLQGELQAKQ